MTDNKRHQISRMTKTLSEIFLCWLTLQQHVSISKGRICLDNWLCCHTDIEVPDQTGYLTWSHCIDSKLISPSADPLTPATWQGCHFSTKFSVTALTQLGSLDYWRRDDRSNMVKVSKGQGKLDDSGGGLFTPKEGHSQKWRMNIHPEINSRSLADL